MTRRTVLRVLAVLMLAVPGAAAMGASTAASQEDFGRMIRHLSDGWQQATFSLEPGKAE